MKALVVAVGLSMGSMAAWAVPVRVEAPQVVVRIGGHHHPHYYHRWHHRRDYHEYHHWYRRRHWR